MTKRKPRIKHKAVPFKKKDKTLPKTKGNPLKDLFREGFVIEHRKPSR